MRRLSLILMAGAVLLPAQVTFDRIADAKKEPQNWITYFGDYSGVRYRELDQINTANVKSLRMEWIFQIDDQGRFQTTPLVVDGVMYLTGQSGRAYALDARTGRKLWSYRYPLAENAKICCGTINRGFGLLGDRLFMVTPNAHVIALDRRTGHLLWDSVMADSDKGYGATLAPLVVKDKVIVGVSGGEFGIRGFVDAYNANTGERAWRFYTIPAKGEPGGDTWLADSWQRGGGPTWMTGTYDPELNLLYWGVGNPGPDLYGDVRKGDNLYACSLLALNPDTGKLAWHFQFTPHDTHDWDANETPMLLDLQWRGQKRKVVVQANRNGFFYLLDRKTGEFLQAKEIVRQTWAKQIDDKGRPVVLPNTEPSPDGTKVCPSLAGGPNWMAPSYNPNTGWFYVAVRQGCDVFYSMPPAYIEGQPFWGSGSRGSTDEPEWGTLEAIDPISGQKKWQFRYQHAPWAGTLATSGGLIFAGDDDGYLMAFDARSGKNLWRFLTGYQLATSPITFMVEGRQHITMPAGASVMTFALP